ncbi:hypothetical protein PGT21_006057 [Puccinia graminis f. sp. tritici]|uniref:Uncharacterized protein n=1 Tax=Puccinia graminis f. sp. tritici TaxID=56615 RepID=A0A5B0QW34_PUCGR|nr:hypothetical protein PGT21_006057 [Puccinia graminis f. sp. tritici]
MNGFSKTISAVSFSSKNSKVNDSFRLGYSQPLAHLGILSEVSLEEKRGAEVDTPQGVSATNKFGAVKVSKFSAAIHDFKANGNAGNLEGDLDDDVTDAGAEVKEDHAES